MHSVARWLSWLKRLTSNEEIPSSNLGRAFLDYKNVEISRKFLWVIEAWYKVHVKFRMGAASQKLCKKVILKIYAIDVFIEMTID